MPMGALEDRERLTMWCMCQDCPTANTRARGVGRELLADFLLPFIIYGLVIGSLIVTGTWIPF
jgi:NADH:ubiquinone oxidoreductase subunit 6 (subunit J)